MTQNVRTPTVGTGTAGGPRPSFSVHFSARDLLNTAIFAAIYVVIVFAIAMLGIISPLVMLLTLPLSAIAAGIPYLLFLTRVRHAGMVTLFGTVVALLLFMMGHPWQSTALTILLSVVAELVLAAGRYRSKWAAIWTYVVFCAWFAGPWIPFFLDPVSYFQRPSAASMGEAYLREFQEVVTLPAIAAMVAATLACGLLGGLLGTRLLRKHFQKAGLA